jgi:hypothetical protein
VGQPTLPDEWTAALPCHRGDPFDRLLAAEASVEHNELVICPPSSGQVFQSGRPSWIREAVGSACHLTPSRYMPKTDRCTVEHGAVSIGLARSTRSR